MARINNDMVEGTSGKVGDVVYKTRNRKTFITKKSDRSKVVSTKKQAKGRKKFAAAVKFAKAVISILIAVTLSPGTHISTGFCKNYC